MGLAPLFLLRALCWARPHPLSTPPPHASLAAAGQGALEALVKQIDTDQAGPFAALEGAVASQTAWTPMEAPGGLSSPPKLLSWSDLPQRKAAHAIYAVGP